MPVKRAKFSKDFYETQRQQWSRSLFVFFVLIFFYLFAVGFMIFGCAAIIGLFVRENPLSSPNTLLALASTSSVIALIIATFHYFDAKKHGAAYIRKRLLARFPDLSDRYHKQFANTLDEMRIAGGLSRVSPYILPTFAINSLALIESDGTPSICVTEGLIAEFTRDELQAVIAHELAHVTRGDSYYITLVCSLANFFERLREAVEPENPSHPKSYPGQVRGGGAPLIYLALTVSSLIMHLLSTLVSRQREILADAAAVEFSRNPKALARAIYKAHLKNSFVGDFNIAYSPLLIVPPRSTGITDGFFSRLFNSHPPLMRRIRLLADMVPTKPAKIIQEVWDIHKSREKARLILHAQEEIQLQTGDRPKPEHGIEEEGRIWMIQSSGGRWEGPKSLRELIHLDSFNPNQWIRNIQEGLEAPAMEFPQIRNALKNPSRTEKFRPSKKNRCPRCGVPLHDTFYEGVAVKICPDCGGKLIDSAVMERVIARREVTFSDQLKKKAQEFEESFLLDPILRKKIHADKSPKISCPNCGSRMMPRPYNYQYVIPVDKCLVCHKIWFDSDELEILQILIEH
jgi:Zn-dependent protease with chaperone function/Zn-finger nucleic acid-binding protein